ncbi:hypothetical protein NEF87_004003 [Candidatus Lokiarchaeum ossiferum]|uniref:Metallo-beta-lactamase domain-containing protein n=1 Tax=Candidatus Lokiarchaeum ossiferum TaxID=2951803 RepID=A0ABY6HWI8_9ARCH|nr:hypothetical protein NEF87_004003 [Candidatus Lokiarchaeum sp. B-35]
MDLPNLENLEITQLTPEVFFIHQIKASSYFTRSDGILLLPSISKNKTPVILDLNLEPKEIMLVYDTFNLSQYSKIDYIISHGHMDHIANVYKWEELGATIHCPDEHKEKLVDVTHFYGDYGFYKGVKKKIVEKFAPMMGYHECKNLPQTFKSGNTLVFDLLKIETISLYGHSVGHVGFFLPDIQLLHISCVGFDLQDPKELNRGFGPWYGFDECNLDIYQADITKLEKKFMEEAKIMTSSHSYIVYKKNSFPFDYMRKKIENNQKKVDDAIRTLHIDQLSQKEQLQLLLDQDIFFPKAKMISPLREIFTYWEKGIIKHHLK